MEATVKKPVIVDAAKQVFKTMIAKLQPVRIWAAALDINPDDPNIFALDPTHNQLIIQVDFLPVAEKYPDRKAYMASELNGEMFRISPISLDVFNTMRGLFAHVTGNQPSTPFIPYPCPQKFFKAIVATFVVSQLQKQGYDIGFEGATFTAITKAENAQALKAIMAKSHTIEASGEVKVDAGATQTPFDATKFVDEYTNAR